MCLIAGNREQETENLHLIYTRHSLIFNFEPVDDLSVMICGHKILEPVILLVLTIVEQSLHSDLLFFGLLNH